MMFVSCSFLSFLLFVLVLLFDFHAHYFFFFFSSRRRHTRSVSAFLLNRSSDLHSFPTRKVNANNSAALTGRSTPLIMFSVNSAPSKIGRAVQQECRDRSRMPSSA